MKKLFILALLFCLCVTAVVSAEDKFQIMTTVFPAYDFSKQICGEIADVSLLLPPGADNHSFEPDPSDLLRISESDLLIVTGGEGDAWLNNIIEALGKDAPKTVSLLDMVEPLEEELKEGMEDNDEKDENETEYDEHVWTSPKNALTIVRYLCDLFQNEIPEKAEFIQQQAESYCEELQELDNEYTALTQRCERRLLIFGDRFPFRYLVEDYDLDYYAAFPGCSTEVTPSASTVAFLINQAQEQKVPVILYLEFSNHEIADVIADAAGAKTAMIHSCHNVSAEDLENGISYIDLMRNNESVLNNALNANQDDL